MSDDTTIEEMKLYRVLRDDYDTMHMAIFHNIEDAISHADQCFSLDFQYDAWCFDYKVLSSGFGEVEEGVVYTASRTSGECSAQEVTIEIKRNRGGE